MVCRCRVQGAGCRVQGAGCRVQGAGCRVQGAGCRVQGAGCRVQGVGWRVAPAAAHTVSRVPRAALLAPTIHPEGVHFEEWPGRLALDAGPAPQDVHEDISSSRSKETSLKWRFVVLCRISPLNFVLFQI
ncbi:hypothetical protein T484DRAFT_3639720 [Baffinella frigidus]|nr:hypothetical protein T484DRAFT_3639720 [Cryptophyta sp. CCMP2293]